MNTNEAFLMESSDEEGEILPDFVDDYHFVDQSNVPVKFCNLPLTWHDEEESPSSSSSFLVFLRGNSTDSTAENQSFCKLAKAWKFDLSDEHHHLPKIEVLLQGKHWITLKKPIKSYECFIRTTLTTLECLHFVKRNPQALGDDVWDCLHHVDGIRPSYQDLDDHVSLLCQAMKRDEDLTKSKCLHAFLEKTSQMTTPIEVEPPKHCPQDAQILKEQDFVVDSRRDEENSSDDDDDDSETNLPFDPVCSICDNGGYVLCCDGSCLRSFHPTVAAGVDTECESLGFANEAQVNALGTYLCKNCLYKEHQCYACGQLGSSEENSSQEVFPCSASNCGHFYHPACVSKLINVGDQGKSEELQAKIAAREPFYCPLHICSVCNLSENKNEFPLHLAVCRRCPKAYHRKCLPREITSELNCNEDSFQRTWEGLLPYNRILIYCLDHEIVGDLRTPTRDHLIFPHRSGPRRTLTHGLTSVKEDAPSRSRITDPKRPENLFARLRLDTSRKPKKSVRVNDHLMRQKLDKTERKFSKEEGPSSSAKPSRMEKEAEERVMAIINKVNSSFNMDDFMKSRRVHVKSYQSGYDIGKQITTGLVQTHANAARAALKMLKEGREKDARAIFDPDTLLELMKHKRKLEIYLSPFLHGMRYTSFGRHFTKYEKLQEIVERLHWYVENGDTVVDFCCGSNDFSCLMKEKLGKTGKSCFFKNFDLMPPKNDFNFEKRDWLTVKKEELPDGSQLIMGLNPPFGHKACLANTFIRKALEFKPKILVLIVPSETKRVDEMADYELIWEDSSLLSGMSFYLPGSVDVNDETIEQWNNIPPPLYLWSRKDWSRSHKSKAVEHGHIAEMHHFTYKENFRRAETIPPQGGDHHDADNDMVQDMDLSV